MQPSAQQRPDQAVRRLEEAGRGTPPPATHVIAPPRSTGIVCSASLGPGGERPKPGGPDSPRCRPPGVRRSHPARGRGTPHGPMPAHGARVASPPGRVANGLWPPGSVCTVNGLPGKTRPASAITRSERPVPAPGPRRSAGKGLGMRPRRAAVRVIGVAGTALRPFRMSRAVTTRHSHRRGAERRTDGTPNRRGRRRGRRPRSPRPWPPSSKASPPATASAGGRR